MSNHIGYQSPAANSKTPSARAIYDNRLNILNAWVARVKVEVPTAAALSNPILINTMPLFIEGLAESLCEECSRQIATESSNYAQEHGGERARVTKYGPEQILQEYQILRQECRRALQAVATLSELEENAFQKSFDKAIQESMITYFLVHGRIREQFVATLTHDLRNPIGSVKLAADMIIETFGDGKIPGQLNPRDHFDQIKELSIKILKYAKRADRMIQDLLDASVMQTGEQLDLSVAPCNIENIVIEAIGVRPEKEANRLVVHNRSIDGFWDPDALQRCLENLISNAFKYGDRNKAVTITVQHANRRLMVSVHNYGNPIPSENAESLFQVFRRAEAAKAGTVKGWGIGLALARSTAERMGGSLGVDSSLEQGTTFTIDIPCDARPFKNAHTSEG